MEKKNSKTGKTQQGKIDLVRINGMAVSATLVVITLGVAVCALLDSMQVPVSWTILVMCIFSLVGLYFLFALKIAQQWEKAVVLRLGKFRQLAGPGMVWIIPRMATAGSRSE